MIKTPTYYFQALALYPLISGKVLLPGVAFSSIALINQLFTPLGDLSRLMPKVINAIVSTRRLKAFLLVPEVPDEENNRGWHLLGDDDDDEEDSMDEQKVQFNDFAPSPLVLPGASPGSSTRG